MHFTILREIKKIQIGLTISNPTLAKLSSNVKALFIPNFFIKAKLVQSVKLSFLSEYFLKSSKANCSISWPI